MTVKPKINVVALLAVFSGVMLGLLGASNVISIKQILIIAAVTSLLLFVAFVLSCKNSQ